MAQRAGVPQQKTASAASGLKEPLPGHAAILLLLTSKKERDQAQSPVPFAQYSFCVVQRMFPSISLARILPEVTKFANLMSLLVMTVTQPSGECR